ncbi:biotin carboxyl carrier domain-containing protein [Vibrio sp. vnigr-6D03]|uniref:Biotin carboxyl carrier protein of acetyl-CoA carboxylase n=1 Tax=Vibrio penaeicida TaxID=104609 RepID=A0AAV5NNC8_9VIBR|nr:MULTISPECIES: acetyl-CoA carboxylase [Vibrio]MDP2573703.1 acetyl-CoA carboxylase [Vibrio penaeicida]PKF81088.1 biotin carboxyl carrier domain-containing protein [Vibrio sp. vnigr-6D03]RTZ22895.1 biotin carboxyl carrier domain-containing protein [Vibrio penaeicida]GLQ72145.1 acetyl-CoA carboxylase biotin carboxyl carrier protein subunit [Vibrio penaeicida]
MSDKEIICPLPGVFYRSSAPEQPFYKQAGDTLSPGDVIGLVEVMKSFHEIKAEVSGVIDDFLLDNETPVNAGQPIVRLK